MALRIQGSVARGGRRGPVAKGGRGSTGDAQNPTVEEYMGEPELYPTTTTTTEPPPPPTTTTTEPPPPPTTTTVPPVTTTPPPPPITTTTTEPPPISLFEFIEVCDGGYGSTRVAQSVTPDKIWDITSIVIGELYGITPDQAQVSLYTYHPTNPYSGVLLGTSLPVPITGTPTDTLFTFAAPIQVGAKFWIVVEPVGATTQVHTWRTALDLYAGGEIAHSVDGGANWTIDIAFDMCELWINGFDLGPLPTTTTTV